MDIHILDVGCGSMALVKNPDGSRFVIDCNITGDNKSLVLKYTREIFGAGARIDKFINTHRDADHMRGIVDLHAQHPIQEIWDTGVPGTTTDSTEYLAYMRLRNSIVCRTIEPRKFYAFGDAKYRIMSAAWSDYSDPNEASAVIKIEYRSPNCSVMFAADTNYRPWKEKILPFYSDDDLRSSLLLGAHHGSLTFFDDPSDSSNYYTKHLAKIAPQMTLISVGPNVHELPNATAIQLYEKYTSGSNQGNKVFTTEKKGHMKIWLKDDGNWQVSTSS